MRGLRAALGALLLAASLIGCSNLPRDVPRTLSEAWPHPEETPLGRAIAAPEHPIRFVGKRESPQS